MVNGTNFIFCREEKAMAGVDERSVKHKITDMKDKAKELCRTVSTRAEI